MTESDQIETYHNCTVRHLRNEVEFNLLDDVYQNCFGAHSVPSQRQKEWWMHSPKNILGLFYNDKLIGGVSFWSINFDTFEKLKTGQLQERNINVKDFNTTIKNLYYLSDLAIKEAYRKKQFSNLLLIKLFEQLASEADVSQGIKILALAYSNSGNKILNRLGFVKIKDAVETLDEQDLLLLELSNLTDLEKLMNQLC